MSRIFVLDLGGGSLVTNTSCGSRGGAQRGPAPTPLFLDQNEARRADKKKFESTPLIYLTESNKRSLMDFNLISVI